MTCSFFKGINIFQGLKKIFEIFEDCLSAGSFGVKRAFLLVDVNSYFFVSKFRIFVFLIPMHSWQNILLLSLAISTLQLAGLKCNNSMNATGGRTESGRTRRMQGRWILLCAYNYICTSTKWDLRLQFQTHNHIIWCVYVDFSWQFQNEAAT